MGQNKFAVLTDSTCDLPPELAQKEGVDILNFEITVDGKSYTERDDFTFDEYYDMLRNCESVPSTAHITTMRFLAKFNQYYKDGIENVIYVSINSTGSATYNSAKMAKIEFLEANPSAKMNIYIIDSHSYSMGYGWYVAQAVGKLRNGAEATAVVAWLKDIFSQVEITLAAFTLKFMKKSGRISAAAAFAGELLGLRPIISLTNGVSTVQKKVRGDKEVFTAMMEFTRPRMNDTLQYSVGGTSQQKIDELAALCEKKWKVAPYTTFKLGAAVSTNTGPDAIAIVFLGEART